MEGGGGGGAEGKEVPSRKICASTSVWVRQQALTEAALPTQSSRKTSWKQAEPALVRSTTTSFPIAFLYGKIMHKDAHQSTPEPWRGRASVLLFSTAWGAEDIHAVINMHEYMCFYPQSLRLDHMLRMHHIPHQCGSLGKQTPTAGQQTTKWCITFD